MKWITHQTGAGLCALSLGLGPMAGVCALLGGIVPDLIDQKLSRMAGKANRQKVFNRIHRGGSHWFGWWLALFIVVMILPQAGFFNGLIKDLVAGVAIGALSHVGLDALTPRGVPLLPLKTPLSIALPLCSTGKASEYIFLAAMVSAALFFYAGRSEMIASSLTLAHFI